MASNHDDKERLTSDIIHQLSHTPYACSSLEPLLGGTANFLYRGTLAQAFAEGTRTIVVKHSEAFASVNRHFDLNISRCIYETIMLDALSKFRPIQVGTISVRTPRLYQSDRNTYTQILEDLTGNMDLKTVLELPEVSQVLMIPESMALGRALGAWLQCFHSWVLQPSQAGLKKAVVKNAAMREVRYEISYGAFIDVVKRFPKIWEANKRILEEVRSMAATEYAKMPEEDEENGWGLIHGDFWTGNVMIPDVLNIETRPSKELELFVVDWELVQYGRKEFDLGQMIGDLYERKHFTGDDSSLRIIEGFLAGYGALSDDEAFRIAIHAGQHLICWYIRRDPALAFAESREQIQDVILIGTDFIVKGWERNRKWFEGSDLACLFPTV